MAPRKEKNVWDWENTWFNPYQSEYLAKRDAVARREATDYARTSQNRNTYDRVYGPGSYDRNKATEKAQSRSDTAAKNDFFKQYGYSQAAQEAWANGGFGNQGSQDEGGLTFEDLMGIVGGSSDGGGGGGGGPSAQQLTDAIRKSYEGQIQNLETNRTNSSNLIQQFANQFKTNLQPITQQFQGATQASVGEIARRAAQGQADTNNLVKELSGSLTGLGVSAQPLQQQARISAQQAAQGSQYEQDFTNRLSQIAAMNDANSLANNELVRQGAAGSLEQNYSQMLSALQNARDQEILGAQTASYGGGGGGGSGGGSDPLDQVTKYLKGQQLFDEVMGGGTDYTSLQSLMSAGAKKDPNAFLASILGLTDEQRQSLGIN